MTTLGGHSVGSKIALAADCYYHDKVTGFISVDQLHDSFSPWASQII